MHAARQRLIRSLRQREDFVDNCHAHLEPDPHPAYDVQDASVHAAESSELEAVRQRARHALVSRRKLEVG